MECAVAWEDPFVLELSKRVINFAFVVQHRALSHPSILRPRVLPLIVDGGIAKKSNQLRDLSVLFVDCFFVLHVNFIQLFSVYGSMKLNGVLVLG